MPGLWQDRRLLISRGRRDACSDVLLIVLFVMGSQSCELAHQWFAVQQWPGPGHRRCLGGYHRSFFFSFCVGLQWWLYLTFPLRIAGNGGTAVLSTTCFRLSHLRLVRYETSSVCGYLSIESAPGPILKQSVPFQNTSSASCFPSYFRVV